MNWQKLKQNLNITLFLTAFFIAVSLFVISWHNLDVINGYAMLFNDINAIEHCDDNFMNIREINDCGAVYCPDYSTIYVKSKVAEAVGFIILIGIIIEFLLIKWKKKYQS